MRFGIEGLRGQVDRYVVEDIDMARRKGSAGLQYVGFLSAEDHFEFWWEIWVGCGREAEKNTLNERNVS